MTDRYIKVPHAVQDDGDLWTDDARLAAYVRLRMGYDLTWPHPAPIPRSVKASVLDWLVAHRHVQRDDDRYVVRDVQRDRERRVERTLNATSTRAQRQRQSTDTENDATTPRTRSGSNGMESLRAIMEGKT